jgi:putative membrane protein
MLSTASSPTRELFPANRFLQATTALYAAVWVVTAIRPVYPTDWMIENLLVLAAVPTLVLTHRRFPLSDLSYLLLALFLMLHAVGAHYTYAEVPLGFWLRDAFGLGRNHFDRIVHCSFGLLVAYPVREMFLRLVSARGFWAYYFPLDVTLAFSGLYEILEMIVARIVSPEAGDAYLGTQGDPFDAVMDMTCAAAGAVVCMLATMVVKRLRRQRLPV